MNAFTNGQPARPKLRQADEIPGFAAAIARRQVAHAQLVESQRNAERIQHSLAELDAKREAAFRKVRKGEAEAADVIAVEARKREAEIEAESGAETLAEARQFVARADQALRRLLMEEGESYIALLRNYSVIAAEQAGRAMHEARRAEVDALNSSGQIRGAQSLADLATLFGVTLE